MSCLLYLGAAMFGTTQSQILANTTALQLSDLLSAGKVFVHIPDQYKAMEEQVTVFCK